MKLGIILLCLWNFAAAHADDGCSCLSRADEVEVHHTGLPLFGSRHSYFTKLIFKAQSENFVVVTDYEMGVGISRPVRLEYDVESLSRRQVIKDFLGNNLVNYSSAYAEGQGFVDMLTNEINQLMQVAELLTGTPADITAGREAIGCAVDRLQAIQKKAVLDVLKLMDVRVGGKEPI